MISVQKDFSTGRLSKEQQIVNGKLET